MLVIVLIVSVITKFLFLNIEKVSSPMRSLISLSESAKKLKSVITFISMLLEAMAITCILLLRELLVILPQE